MRELVRPRPAKRGNKSLGDCPDRDAGHLHGGAGHQRRQCGLAAHRRQPLGRRGREHLGPDLLPRFQCHRAAAYRLALLTVRAQALLHDLRRPLHHQLVPLRPGALAAPARVLPHSARGGRGRSSTHIPGHPGGELPETQAGHGDGHLRHGRGGSPHPWPHPGWLDHGRLQLALDFLHQHPGRRAFPAFHLPADLRSPVPGQEELPGNED